MIRRDEVVVKNPSQIKNVQRAKTVHGNSDSINQIVAAIRNDSDDNIRLYYMNKKRIPTVIEETVRKHGLLVPSGIIHTINDPGSPVKQKIYSQIDTRQFKNWFGDSVVKDDNGNPLVVYHGTNAKFTSFDIKKAKPGLYGKGFYFSKEQSQANAYGESGAYYLSIENPLQPG